MTSPRPANPLLEAASRPAPRRVAVIGAGTIGPDIGYYLKAALPGLELVLLDVRQEAVDAALARLKGYADKAVARGKMSAKAAQATLAGLTGGTDYEVLRGCDWVIEAATEDLALKRRIFAEVEARVAADVPITSNTSSLPAQRIFSEMAHPERATVTHFFAPAWRNPAVEVVDWPGAGPALVGWLRRLFAQTGKVPLVTADVACFMLDRVFDNWCNEAALLLDEASAAQIDSVAAEFVQAGPFFVLNLAHGNPIIIETNSLQADEEGEHYRPAPVFRSVERWNTVAPGREIEVPEPLRSRIRDRLLGVLLSQSVDILDRTIGGAADLDLGCRLALGLRPGMPRALRDPAAYLPAERHVLVDRMTGPASGASPGSGSGAGVIVITLRRPEALNALHDELTDEVLAVIRRHEGERDVAGFVIVGYGTRAFCAGADIGKFPSMLGDATAAVQYSRDCSRLLVHLDRSSKPVVAALNGMALGGGFELAMRCHSLVAERGAWMQLPEVTLGILPGIGAMVVPYRRWPKAAAVFHSMLTRAERIKAVQAHELGIVDELADGVDDLLARAVARVHALAGAVPAVSQAPVTVPPFEPSGHAMNGQVLSRAVIAIIESAVRDAAAAPSLEAALQGGYLAFGEVACRAAAREGITAFQQRRAPDFSTTG
jgi:enoyl-CoA hydratase/3-hydroxyacyl-CoA dehydrogenase